MLADDSSRNAVEVAKFLAGRLEQLLKFLINFNSPANRNYRNRLVEQKFEKELNNKSGLYSLKKLQQSKEKLRPIAIPLTDSQLKDFNRLAKQYGILYSSISNQSKDGSITPKDHTIIIKEKDLALVKAVTDRMNLEIKLKDNADRIAALEDKDKLTAAEEKELKALYKEKGDIVHDETVKFNNNKAETIFEGIENDTVDFMQVSDVFRDETMSFDMAVNSYTDLRNFTEDMPIYICERTNPNSYMEAISQPMEYDGRIFTNTEFKVYNNGEEQSCDEFKHGKFSHYSKEDGKNSSTYGDKHWQNMKIEMKEKGGFTDDVVVFHSRSMLEKYQQLYSESINEKTVTEQQFGFRDYNDIQEKLKNQLEKYNAELNIDGKAVDKETKQILTMAKTANIDEKLRVAESTLIARKITNYEQLNKLQTELAMDTQELLNSPHGEEIQARIEQTEKDIEKCLLNEQWIDNRSKQLSGIEAANEAEKNYELQWDALLNQAETENYRIELKEIEEREREVGNNDTYSMDEWQGQIDEARQNISRDNSVSDKAFEKAITSKEDR